jgi:hypothetical protein
VSNPTDVFCLGRGGVRGGEGGVCAVVLLWLSGGARRGDCGCDEGPASEGDDAADVGVEGVMVDG